MHTVIWSLLHQRCYRKVCKRLMPHLHQILSSLFLLLLLPFLWWIKEDTCSPDTSCISTCIPSRRLRYTVSATKLLSLHNVGYPLISSSRTLLRTCIRLHVSGVNAALRLLKVVTWWYHDPYLNPIFHHYTLNRCSTMYHIF